jgi:hypothetical protein
MTARQISLVSIKVGITFGLLWLLVHRIDMRELGRQLQSAEKSWVTAATAILFVQLLLTGLRWHLVARLVSTTLALGQALRLVMIGQFFSQVLPTSFGGDAVRAWLLSREIGQLGRAVVSIVCDRAAALLVLTVLVAVCVPALAHFGLGAPLLDDLAIIAPSLVAGGIATLLLASGRFSARLQGNRYARPFARLAVELRTALLSSGTSIVVLGLTLVVQLLMVATVVAFGRAIGIELGLLHALLIPLISLVSMFPLSFAGWGVREGAMVVGLGLAGISAPEALATSVLLGLAQIVVGLPGGILWLTQRQKTPSALPERGG